MLIRYQSIYTPSPLSPVGLLIDPNIQSPYAQVFTGGIQHVFGKATVVDAAYVGTRGYNFRMARTYNEPDRLTGIRPNTSLSQATYVDDSQETTYNSLQTSMRHAVLVASCRPTSITPCRRRAPTTTATTR